MDSKFRNLVDGHFKPLQGTCRRKNESSLGSTLEFQLFQLFLETRQTEVSCFLQCGGMVLLWNLPLPHCVKTERWIVHQVCRF